MNGLVPMTLGSWKYYDHELSVEDYFLSHGQEAGVWVGSGAAAIGLSGTVEEGQLARLFDEGRHPVSGAPLGAPYRHDSKRTVVTGYALSFSPPKSVSLVGAFGDRETAAEVRAAHDSAGAGGAEFPGGPCFLLPDGPRRGDPGRHRGFRGRSVHAPDLPSW